MTENLTPPKKHYPWERIVQFVISAIMAIGMIVLIWMAYENSKLITRLIELH